jgi:hypothetical protein
VPLQSNSSSAVAAASAKASAAESAGKPADAVNSAKAASASAATANKVAEGKSAQAVKPAKLTIPLRGRYLRVRVGAENARVDFFAGWRRPRVVASHQVDYRPGVATLPEAVEAVDGLLSALASTTVPLKGLRCDFVIGDSWMLYDVVRADLRSLSPRAADDVVRSALADMAGVPPSDLATRWQTQTGGHSTLACGMPAAVLPTLNSVLRSHRLRSGAIVGEFVHEFNAHREQLATRSAVISLVRETGAQLAIGTNGVVTAMSFELGVRAPEELETRGRSLLRGAGLGSDADARFFALLPSGWTPPAPWHALTLTI